MTIHLTAFALPAFCPEVSHACSFSLRRPAHST